MLAIRLPKARKSKESSYIDAYIKEQFKLEEDKIMRKVKMKDE